MTASQLQDVRKVGVIGVGSIGGHMARHVGAAGFELTVCDVSEAALAPFIERGQRTVKTSAECVDCDVVIVLVATAEQLNAVTLGQCGLIHIPAGHRPRYIVVSSTVAPGDMHVLADAFADLPVRIVDAPVSGGVVGAQKAALTFLVGGLADDVDLLRPLFHAMGKSIFHCGGIGSGQTTKAINNVIAISNLLISAEAYSIALANGLTLDKLIPTLEGGSARNFLSRDASEAPEVYAAWSKIRRDFDAVQEINRKDFDLALALGPPHMALPTISAFRRLLNEVGDETFQNWRRIAGLGELSP